MHSKGFSQRTAGDAANTTQAGTKLAGARVLTYTEQNVKAAFELANKLVRAKDPHEAVALQGEYLKTQLAALQTRAKEFDDIPRKSVAPFRAERVVSFVPAFLNPEEKQWPVLQRKTPPPKPSLLPHRLKPTSPPPIPAWKR